MNRRARELVCDRLIDAGAPDGQLRCRSGRPAQLLHCLILLPPFRRAPIQLDDAVAGLDAGTLGRRVRQRRDDGDPAIAHIDLDAESGVVAGRGLGELPEVIRFQEYRIGIVQLVEHALDRHLVQLALVERIDVIVGDVRQHVVEQACLLVDRSGRLRFALQEPAARNHRGGDDGGNHEPFMANHHVLLSESVPLVTARTSRQAASCTAFFG